MALKTVQRLNDIEKITSKELVDVAYPVFKAETPIDTGNARRRTRKTGDEIIAEYPYALRLEQGWSKQSPDGMVKPAIEAVRKYITRKLGK